MSKSMTLDEFVSFLNTHKLNLPDLVKVTEASDATALEAALEDDKLTRMNNGEWSPFIPVVRQDGEWTIVEDEGGGWSVPFESFRTACQEAARRMFLAQWGRAEAFVQESMK